MIPQGLPYIAQLSHKVETVSEGKPLRLMFLGRISHFKGLHLLLKALQGLSEELVTLDIYGQPADEVYGEACRLMVKGRTNIHWKGMLAQEEVVTSMQHYDVLCLCSTFSEMSPLVIQEAFAAGIPVIASKVYGNQEQIKHGVNGLLFDFNDVNSLRVQIQACIQDRLLLKRLAHNIKPPTDFSRVTAAYYQLYQNLLSAS